MRSHFVLPFALASVVLLSACGRKNVTYDVTIDNPYADLQGVTATIESKNETKVVPVSGAKPTIPLDLPEIKIGDDWRQKLIVTLHAPLPCGKVDLQLEPDWAPEAEDIALTEKHQHPKVTVTHAKDVTPKRCDTK
jgi:hypothetical protein